jgi:phosphate acetyltransferase
MSLINNLCLRLERHPKRVVFPEGNDVRILQAARKFAVKKLGVPILLGNRLEIKALANKLDIKLDHIRIIDPLKSEERPRFKQFLHSIYRFKDKGEIDLERLLDKNTYFAALMLATSQTDAMVSGANSQASSSLRPLLQIIPFQNKNKLISSLNIFDLEDQTTGQDKELFLADCAVIN